jgi:thiol-disulfide isomerase/thioredoxin
MVRRIFVVGVILSALACRSHERQGPPASGSSDLHAPQFIEGDYEFARSEAERRGLPLFVDVWASWCHTCLSFRQYVVPDPELAPLSDSFVWLAIDSESASSRPFLERYPTRNLPTLWVIEPKTQTPLLRWIGAATPRELVSLLRAADEQQALQTADPNQGGSTRVLVRAQRVSAEGSPYEAIVLYRAALAGARPDWPLRARALEGLSMRLSETGQDAEVVRLALDNAEDVKPGTALVNLLVNGLNASQKLPIDAAERAQLPRLIQLGTCIAEDTNQPILLDDRSSLFMALVEAQSPRDPNEAQRLAKIWSSALDSAAAKAKTPAARRVWDPHRVEAYLALHEEAKAVPMLQKSEKENPEDYNAPARLARVFLAMNRRADAEAAIERAVTHCDGPRRLRLYLLQADILVAKEDRDGARTVLEKALDYAKELDLPEQYDELRASIEKKRDELSSG